MTTFQTERFHDIWPEIQPLLRRHWDEIARKDICGPLDINEDIYRRLELAGALLLVTARLRERGGDGEGGAARAVASSGDAGWGAPPSAGRLVGYAAYFLSPHPHYQRLLVAEADVFFLEPEQRRGATGLRLLRAAERAALAAGAHTLVQKVKTDHDCGAIFRRMGYSHAENIWIKAVR